MARKCARTFSIVVEKGKKSILDVGHLLPVGIARSVRPALYSSYSTQLQLYRRSPYILTSTYVA